MGLSVWLVPTPTDASRLKHLMHFSELIPSVDYPVAPFEPHITLASFAPSTLTHEDLKAAITRQKTSLDFSNDAGADSSTPHISLAFRALSTGEAYFRSVLLDIDISPSLNNLHDLVFNAVPNSQPKSPRFPHLSLFYISEEHATVRERIREALWLTYGESVGGDRVTFRLPSATEDGRKEPMSGIGATEIQIVRCEGPTEEWEILEKITLDRLAI